MDSRFDLRMHTLGTRLTRRLGFGLLTGLGLGRLVGADQAAAHKCKHCPVCKRRKRGAHCKCENKPNGTPCPPAGSCLFGTCRYRPGGGGGQSPPPPPPPPPCPPDQQKCGGQCYANCPTDRIRNPLTCGCCRPSGLVEPTCGPAERDPCCSGLACHARATDGGTVCPGQGVGQPCSFSAQCEPGLFCNLTNLVCAEPSPGP